MSESIANTIAYALSNAYAQWMRMFVEWHSLQHPQDMGQLEIEDFLAIMAE